MEACADWPDGLGLGDVASDEEEELGEAVGLGEALGDVVVLGDGVGELELGLGLGLGLGVVEAGGLDEPDADGWDAVGGQVRGGVPDLLVPMLPGPPPLPLVPFIGLTDELLALPPPPPPGGTPCVLLEVLTDGSTAIAQDAEATTKTPVASAAAGRSQPRRSLRPGSRLNLIAIAPAACRSQAPAGPGNRQIGSRKLTAASHQCTRAAFWRAAILARIRSSPSAAGSTESTASLSALRSTPSRPAGYCSGRRWLMPHAPGLSAGTTSPVRYGSSRHPW